MRHSYFHLPKYLETVIARKFWLVLENERPNAINQNETPRFCRLAPVLNFFFINVSYHKLVASLILMALF